MGDRTRRALRAYWPPLALMLGGLVLAEILMRLAQGLHVQVLASLGSWLSLAGLVAGTAWMLLVTWRVWRHRTPPPAGGGVA